MKIIVIGSGGREHAIAWALSKSPRVGEVLCIPGNGGTAREEKCRNIPVSVSETASVVEVCKNELSGLNDGSFIVIGPEDPLAAGIVNRLSEEGLDVVGPQQSAAALEASKDVAKRFMNKYGVACAKSETFTGVADAVAALEDIRGPVVIKADGLAGGKGVVITDDNDTAIRTLRDFIKNGTLGVAGRKILLEEYLAGDEISILAAVSVSPKLAEQGRASIVPFLPARDHKRLLDGAQGPNTGGMGAIAPVPGLAPEILERFRTDILEPTLKGLIAENHEYRGFLFFGVMITGDGPKLLEYNVRLGDPETQAVLPLMDFDFADMCRAIIDGTLSSFQFKWRDGYVCAPVAVSGGYPASYLKGLPIKMNKQAIRESGAKIFIAGATTNRRKMVRRCVERLSVLFRNRAPGPGELITSGGRVLSASAFGSTIDEARSRAYRALDGISFERMFFRRDIGLPGAAVSPETEKKS